MSPADVMRCLCFNLDPATGKLLRPHAKEGDRVGMDFTFNCPKSVSLAREIGGPDNAGDPLVEYAHREAVEYAMTHIEADMKTRIKGGREGERLTGNLCAYRVTHRDTRINPDDQMPDPHLHDHVYVMNQTFDPVTRKWMHAEVAGIKHDAPYFEALYMNRLATNLREIGYGVRREGKAFEITGIDRPLIEKFSRRTAQIEAVAKKLGIKNEKSKAKLGATTRMGKTKETADDLNPYYVSRLTPEERQQLTQLEGQPSYQCDVGKAVRYAIDHIFERQSVTEERKLYETAIRHGIGNVTLDGVIDTAWMQGVLLKEGQATTKAVLAEESRIIQFAREGKGTMRPLAAPDAVRGLNPIAGVSRQTDTATSTALGQQKGRPDESKRPSVRTPGWDKHTATLPPEQQAVSSDHIAGVSKMVGLSPEQVALVNHVLTSTDQVVLLIGDAGTGKTRSVRSVFDEIHCPVEMLAPSATASRDVLRSEGFDKADTVASFLNSRERQAGVKGGVIWVDEAGLLAIRDLSQLVSVANKFDARLVLMGDAKQHSSPARSGNMLNVLQEYAAITPGRLTEIWRQKSKGYKGIVADIAKGNREKAFDSLSGLGWVQKVASNAPLVDEYAKNLRAGKTQLVVAPTHAEADEVTAAIRERLQKDGKLGKEQHVFDRLAPLNWTEAERDDRQRYDGTEILCFHRNSGTFKAGQKVRVVDFKDGDRWSSPSHFSVYRKEEIGITTGDLVRITSNGETLGGNRLNNGAVYRVKGFDKKNNLVLDNGWTVGKDFNHLTHGYVTTSHASQGRTVDRVLIAMGSESRPAITAEQFYVSVSRGRESAKVFSDMPAAELKKAIERADQRISATELMTPKPRRRLLKRLRAAYEQLRDTVTHAMTRQNEKENINER